MNIQELDSYDLGDAVKFNERLNPKLFGPDERLRPEVREQLLRIADDFRQFLGVKDLQIQDITISGSNAAYTYTDHSDIDLHLIVDLPEADTSDVYRELFDAKKYAYNDQHDITIGGADVELYVQDANKPHHSQGIYSLVRNDWVTVPRRQRPNIDDISVKSKFEDLGHRIEAAIRGGDLDAMNDLARKIKNLRQAGLDAHGEFGPENLAFKILRKQGLLDQLSQARRAAKDELLSLDERRKKKRKTRTRYGYGGYWYPGTAYAGQDHPAGTEGGGGDGGGGESLREDNGQPDDESILKDFIEFCVKELKIHHMPRIKLRRDPQWPKVHKTFGRYNDADKTLEVAWGQRHIMDVLRTVAHELTHKHQHERDGERMGPDAGETGSPYENEANARAGILMRDYGRLHPEYFAVGQAHNLEEDASGYIPTKRQAKDPRFSMALTQDIRPGQVGKEANKLKLKTDKQGHPQIARANGLFEQLMSEYKDIKEKKLFALAQEDYSPDEPPGPESRPTMPRGTLRVDVSDVYDWYKLGQHISNMKGLGKHDFGAGPPSSIISFGDEDTEHKFIKDLEATGLDVTDIDPADPKKRPGKKVKTDPTYNVNEDEDLDEVKMSPSALEKFATSDAAKGIRAGFEAELIFRDTQGESEELDPEPNYDADERAYSIQQVIDFFSNDEYGYGLSDRAQNRLMDDLDERYMEWRDEQVMSDFRNDAEDLIRDILLAETPMDQRIHFYLTDSLQMSDEEADAVIKAGADAPRFTNSDAQKDYADENPEYKAYLEAADEAEQELEESVEFSVNRQDEYWDEALDKYRDDYSGDDDSFFSDVGLRWMSDIANEFNLDWPVWDGGQQQNYGSRSWEDIGDSLQSAVDMPVVVSSDYHSTRRREGQWIIEPDGSLDPDDKSEEAGLEIVSPPMPLLTAIEKLRAVTDWANDPEGGNAYTNSSTGLHMGVSLPHMKSEGIGDDIGIDYVKLILFLGDKYVQQQFGREANTYCASAMDKLKQNIKGKRSDPAGVVELLRHGLTELAQRELQKGVGTSKYTSAHIKPGYIEFRSPGGDWLAKADEEIGVLENTMMRFARAMAIAGDPNAERQEYAKKLYKLVTADNPEYADQLKLFSEFSAGTINKEQLKKQWAETVLQKELPGTGKEEYEVYRRDNGNSPDATVGTLYARDYDDAYDQFLRQYGRDINDLDVRIKQPWFDVFGPDGERVTTFRAKDADKALEKARYEFEYWDDTWKIYRRPDDTPEPKASPRAQVAKRIVKPKPPAVGDDEASDWEAVYKPTGRVFDTLAYADSAQAQTWIKGVMRDHGFSRPEDVLLRRVGQQKAADARRDSTSIQRNLGVQDIEPNIEQNFAAGRENYELYSSENPDQIIHRMPYATAEEVRAWIAQQEREGMPPGFLRARIPESIDPVSGAGAIAPRPVIKKIKTDRVEPVEPVVPLPKSRSAIGQAIDQKDIELMTQQIQLARRLGDDVNENFADGKVKGKSRPGRVKRAGASCKGSVTDLRARAKKYGGEKGKMYHWCANMKSGKKK